MLAFPYQLISVIPLNIIIDSPIFLKSIEHYLNSMLTLGEFD